MANWVKGLVRHTKSKSAKAVRSSTQKSLGHKFAFAFCIFASAFGIALIVGLFLLLKDSLTT